MREEDLMSTALLTFLLGIFIGIAVGVGAIFYLAIRLPKKDGGEHDKHRTE